jgi:hypothetical protein
MPTTQNEAESIMTIATGYVPVEKRYELFKRLHEQVGMKTDNSSLAISLKMLFEQVEAALQRRQAHLKSPYRYCWTIAFIGVVMLHTLVVCGNLMAFFVLPVRYDPWIALPACSIIFFLILNRKLECPLTIIENCIREKIGLPPIRGFVGHYFVRPWRK